VNEAFRQVAEGSGVGKTVIDLVDESAPQSGEASLPGPYWLPLIQTRVMRRPAARWRGKRA